MKVLITGALGYVGVELIKKLVNKQILLNDIKPNNLNNYICEDIALMNKPQVDFIVHLAANVGQFQSDEASLVNINGTKNIASFNIPTLYFSSGVVYGDASDICSEDHTCNPQTHYAKSKFIGEQWIKGLDHYCIVRPATMYGVSNSMRNDLLLHTLIKDALHGKVSLYQPYSFRTLYHLGKVVNFIEYCLDNWHLFDKEIINLGCDQTSLTKLEIVNTIRQFHDFKLEFIGGNDLDCRNYKVDYSKLKRLWKDSEDFDFHSHVKELVEYYEKDINNRW